MSDIRFSLPGPDTITLSGHTVDKLIRTGDGDAALLYLFILKVRGECTSGEIAKSLRKNTGDIASAMALLSRIGLIRCDDAVDPPAPEPDEADGPRRYSPDEIKREMETGSGFPIIVEETQRSLGKILSSDELERLLGIYDGLRLPPEVILLLITHCISESRKRGGGRMPSMRYIEKAAYTWEREGIFSLDRAEQYLKELEVRKSARGIMKTALQITNRELSESEKRYVDKWIAMGFDPGAVEIAYDRTVLKTGKLAWNYMDSIMNSWHGKGLHTPGEIMAKDLKTTKSDTQSGTKTPEQKFGPTDISDLERMKRLLKKIKEE